MTLNQNQRVDVLLKVEDYISSNKIYPKKSNSEHIQLKNITPMKKNKL